MCAVSTGHPKQVFKIYAGSTELSPFHDCYTTNETVLRTSAGRFLCMIVAVVILLQPIGR